MTPRWPLVPLAEVLTHYQGYIDEPEPRVYPKLSVKLYGKGVVLDTPADGTSLRMKRHQLARAGQVILSEIWGKRGAVGIVPPEGEGALCTSHFFLFDVRRERLQPGYLLLIFAANYLQEQLDAQAHGTTGYAAVRPGQFLAARIPLPPLDQQRHIVARMDRLANKIQEAHQLRRQAADQAEALVSSYISRFFDGTHMAGRLADVLIERPRNGWSPHCDGAQTGVPVLSLAAVTGFHYRGTEFKRTSEPTSADAHYWLRPGDLLITRSNTPDLVGHAAIYDGAPSRCIYPDLMMRLVVDGQLADTRFVHACLRSAPAREYVRHSAKGTSPSMRKISQETVMGIPFPTGLPIGDQRRMVARLHNLQAKADALKRLQLDTAAALDALLPAVLDRAFTGEL